MYFVNRLEKLFSVLGMIFFRVRNGFSVQNKIPRPALGVTT